MDGHAVILAEFDVIGVPAPQGSKKAFVANGRAVVKEAGGTHALWRNQVAQAARDYTLEHPDECPLDGALGLYVRFRFPMPQSRRKAVRESGWTWKATAPDIDKLVRNVCDGLQAGGLVVDDARFVGLYARKFETVGWTGATISIKREGVT